jgi:2-methylcitrate dehydratase PrpD
MATLSEHLAEFVVTVRYDALPDAVRAMAQKTVLDWAGAVLAGAAQPPAAMARRALLPLGGRPEAEVIGTGARTDALRAALLNGLAAHILEVDDLHRPSTTHAGAPVVAAALAAAERAGVSGPRLVEAVVAGFEVAVRVAEAVNPSHYRFWHTTATCGTFGAAAAAAKVLGLGPRDTAQALGSAGTMAAGLWEFLREGAMSKHLHAGHAAHDGLLAALLAREGFTGARAILEGEQGFFRAMAAGADPGRVTDRLGERFAIAENSFKLFPCCGHTHGAIAAALEVRSRGGVDPPAIDEVRVETYSAALQVTGNPDPQTPYQAKFSLPYTVAAALRWGRVGLGEFEPAALADPEVRGLLGRVRVAVDPALDARYPAAWPARVTVRLKGGPTHSALVEEAPGEDGAAVPYEALAAKFRDLLAWAVGQVGAQPAEDLGGTLAADALRERYAAVPEAVRQLAGVERLGPGALWGAGQGASRSPDRSAGRGAGATSPARG